MDELKASAKQTVKIPTDIVSLEDQLYIFGAVLTIIAGEENLISKGIESLLREMKDNSLEFESLIEAAVAYAAKILYAVDTRIQRFLLQCRRKKDREEVNKRLVDFSDLSESCLSQSFNISLPPAFKVQATEAVIDPFQTSEYAGAGRGKRKRDDPIKVINENQEPEFKMKPEENWLDKFRGQLHGDKPFWDRFTYFQNKASNMEKD